VAIFCQIFNKLSSALCALLKMSESASDSDCCSWTQERLQRNQCAVHIPQYCWGSAYEKACWYWTRV